ncbi:MAG: exopolyphosphatase [Bacteroidota bacterium]
MNQKIAIIDCGTNTFNLLIAAKKGVGFETFYEDEISVRIGNKGINKGIINNDAINRAISVLKGFNQIIEKYNVLGSNVFAFATSAFRNAQNGNDVRQEIWEATNIEVQVIDGTQEAELIFNGVKQAIDFQENVLVMDIGGGSVEFIIGNQHELLWKNSFEIGAQRLVDKFQPSDPITPDELSIIIDYLRREMPLLFDRIDQYKPQLLVGASGTFETLSNIYCQQNRIAVQRKNAQLPFDLISFDKIYQELTAKNQEERSLIPGMSLMRVDMIVVASSIIHAVLANGSFNELRVSHFALKEGALFDLFDRSIKEN